MSVRTAAVCLAPLLAAATAIHAAESRNDFGFGMTIRAEREAALYRLIVPGPVYEAVTRTDLGDMRVFNAAGEAVPYAFLPRETATTEKQPLVKLTLFTLRGDEERGVESAEVSLVRRNGAVEFRMSTRGGARAKTTVVGYVVDAGTLTDGNHKRAIRALEFDLAPDGDYVGRIRVEASDDFTAWRTLAADAPLVRLDAAGARIVRDRVEFAPATEKYLRISWPKGVRPPVIASLRAEPGEAIVAAERTWKSVPGTTTQADEYAFDLGGHFPADRLRVELPQTNTVVAVRFLVRDSTSAEWRPVTSATAYRLQHEGSELRSEDIALRGTVSARYWLMRVDARGGGLGSGVPQLAVGWVPHEIVFAARGAGPFQLAYGARGVVPGAYPVATVVPGFRVERGGEGWTAQVKIETVSVDAPQAIAGAGAIAERIDIKRWALWGSLVIGVVLLGWMARTLMREMNASKGKPPAT